MDISSRKVFDELENHGVTSLYHANSVVTACQFLRNGALLSRGTMERRGLPLTPQSSDDCDKRFSLWFDVFADSVDIHERAKAPNVYGPVLFVLDVKELRNIVTGRVWVTKLNPTKWEGKARDKRWFSSAGELKTGFVRGQFDQMIVFRHCGGELPIDGVVKEVVVDDPAITVNGLEYFSSAMGALKLAATDGNLDVRIAKRRCSSLCSCRSRYEDDSSKSKKLFLPVV